MAVKILVSGFEPFGGSAINPSEQVLAALVENPPAGVELIPLYLPVDTRRAPQMLLDAVRKHDPNAVVCLGEAARRAVVSVERVAINLLDFRIPDNSGAQVIDAPVAADGPAAYFATLPVRKMADAIRAAGVPVELSLSAGAYLCNQVMYTLLHAAALEGRNLRGGFIHLPALPEEALETSPQMATMSLETSLRAIRAALGVLEKEA